MTHLHSPGRMTVLAALLAALAAPVFAAPGGVVISQVYGGGGNSGATYKNDYIELLNTGDTAVTLTNWSVQYASATGTSWQVTKLPASVTLAAGQYYLVHEALGSGGTDALTPDATGTIPMSATAGKVALVNSITALAGGKPVDNVVDLVGFGTTAGYYEGSGATPAPSNTLAVIRKNNGCLDSNDNSSDFVTGAASPRTTASERVSCSGGPLPQPIVLACPGSVGIDVGTGTTAPLQASDADSLVDKAAISKGAVSGISLTGFTPATADNRTATATLVVDASLPAGTYPVEITFGNDASQTASCTVNVAVSGLVKIPQIQGSGLASPYVNTVQTTSGVVTKKLGSGFTIQDPQGDGDPDTSDAIFVFGASTAAAVKEGDLVRVTGTVTEFTPNGAKRSYTELKDVSAATVLGSGNTIQPVNIDLPTELSHYEGMLVRFTSPLTVNGNSYLGDRGELVLANGRRETPTNRYRAGTLDANALIAANAQNMVVLDDGIFTVPPHIPYLAVDKTVRAGDTVTDLVGVLDFGAIGGGGGWYKLQPTETPVFSRTNAREDAPTVVAGNVRVASANVLNFFTTFTDGTDAWGRTGQGCTIGSSAPSRSNCRGADNLAEFNRQRDKIVNELKAMNADAVGLMEIQNNGDITVSYLVDALNQAIGAPTPTYAYVAKPAATGTDAIRVAMIYKPAVLTPVGGALSDGDAVNNRPPMAQTFKVNANGAKFSLIVNHLKSKGSCGGAGAGDTDSGDGQGCWTATRVLQAKRLFTYFIPTVVAAAGDPDVLAVGDFNAYGHEDPIAYLTDNGMVNELERFVRPNGTPYSYVFDGQSGYLDHALASSALDPQVAGVTEWHNNADEPDAIDYNLGDTADDPYVNNPFRASDHDPVVVSLNLAPAYADVTASVKIVPGTLGYNRVTGKFSGNVTFTNTSGAALSGPLQYVLQGLPAGVTLDNKSGAFNGAPYVTLPGTTLAPGAAVTVALTFTNPSKTSITFTSKLYSGTF
ncbi:endonuclease/exonuclease/phosphatase [Massilia sp. Root133]|uniref:ExeM/NucH family extracellular endonuclease n=1 Tax=Massilia cellulosiltytica TaxID=2683234 RepID=A0A7X3FY92_9BURK|nr:MULTISPECIES: ExeM/NucH family extracellular endonuclease [Telluria group]KQY11646.1 endonuclease/exonuclease/phosphatase [Massilia sp. Root133]KQZ46487.1 endonuclease/exonuclease/phosphatase [Massilia sp. Root1485]MVW60157.1 ExeM/NucH family extracellular endonuclease [Telluria cellulosilytica]